MIRGADKGSDQEESLVSKEAAELWLKATSVPQMSSVVRWHRPHRYRTHCYQGSLQSNSFAPR